MALRQKHGGISKIRIKLFDRFPLIIKIHENAKGSKIFLIFGNIFDTDKAVPQKDLAVRLVLIPFRVFDTAVGADGDIFTKNIDLFQIDTVKESTCFYGSDILGNGQTAQTGIVAECVVANGLKTVRKGDVKLNIGISE